ncbi:hypothetical protein SLEP1_g35092 [Rubroshorea leprosula]|uniref:Uncharacterized protein n=1 Tax=Rubroshorea leprosula TaxID=152421 RepID=A0AAV5KM68_9ROSI|nr:hypothetical protein SLEP1_g35092 [Rubroshorea leprosula]
MVPLIDVEKEVEISASISSWASRNLDGSQKRGSAILNLYFGKVEIGNDEFPFFWAMQFGTHDVAILKLNMVDSGALGQGAVYWLKDSLINVAFDNIQEEDLNSPLHLEKESNGGLHPRMKDAFIELSKGLLSVPAADLVPSCLERDCQHCQRRM